MVRLPQYRLAFYRQCYAPNSLSMSAPNSIAISPLLDTALVRPGTFVRYPDSPFELYQPYPPAGDQPEAIDQLVDGVNDGEVFQTLLGVTGSGKTFTMANVIARLGRPAIVFAPNKTLAAQLYSEFREFFPNNAVEYLSLIHISEPTRLGMISYAVFCLKKKKKTQ